MEKYDWMVTTCLKFSPTPSKEAHHQGKGDQVAEVAAEHEEQGGEHDERQGETALAPVQPRPMNNQSWVSSTGEARR